MLLIYTNSEKSKQLGFVWTATQQDYSCECTWLSWTEGCFMFYSKINILTNHCWHIICHYIRASWVNERLYIHLKVERLKMDSQHSRVSDRGRVVSEVSVMKKLKFTGVWRTRKQFQCFSFFFSSPFISKQITFILPHCVISLRNRWKVTDQL